MKRLLNIIQRSFYAMIESSIRNIGGPIGLFLRSAYYSKRFKRCGRNIRIDIGVIFENTENISVGDHVNFLPYSIITARPRNIDLSNRPIKTKENLAFNANIGEIVIGSEVGIGAYNIIQGYGGIVIGDRVTTSAKVSIYSFSHFFRDENRPYVETYANSMIQGEKAQNICCICSPIVVGDACWIGLGVSIFGGHIGRQTFVATNSIVTENLPENSYAKGSPAKKTKDRFDAQE